jgi:ABC-type transport system involved in cytochrome c biogenesis permease subunit
LPELLVFPALLAYGEAALAYGADARRPGAAGRLATWGVRVGWLAQTALLVVQAIRSGGFPWTSWAGALNLFVWLVIGVYLVWGCRARYRLLGLAVTPLAAALLAVAWAGGGTAAAGDSDFSAAFLALHVGLVLAGFAGFTLAAALSGLYLFQERRLKRHEASILRVPAPSLAALDRFSARTIALALPALTLGIAVGLARLAAEGGALDAVVAVTLATWAAYLAYVVVRLALGWRGRRAAYLALAGFALVSVALPIAHFS